MPTLLQQFGRSYDAECGSSSENETLSHSQEQQQQQQQQQQQRERADRERDRERERKHLHKLQSISSLLLDLPPASSGSYMSGHARDSSYLQTPGGSLTDGDMSISDLFGLGLPRGSLMGGNGLVGGGNAGGGGGSSGNGNGSGAGQTAIGSPGGYRSHQQYHNTSSLHSQPAHHLCEYEDSHGYWPTSSHPDMPGSPSSVTTPGSPSTPGSVYSNPYTYATAASNSTSTHTTSSPSNRMQLQQMGSPPSPIHSQYYGRPIRGSPSYSDCGSPTLEYTPMMGYSGSRSNSPADSETSGVSSMDGSLSDIMNCLSMNPGQHPCYLPTLSSLMSPEAELCSSGRASAYPHMAAKKYLSSPHQQQQQQQQQSALHHHHSHNHMRDQYVQNQTRNYLSSLLSSEKNCCLSGSPHVMSLNGSPLNGLEQQSSLDRAARFHRNAASLYDATCTWSGLLPQRTQKPLGYSSKVFLGGVPWDITESLLISTFKQFGQIRVEWPGKEPSATQPKGYVYVIFESEKQVKALLAACTHDFTNGGSWYYKISSKRTKGKEVEVIPWVLNDSNFVKSSSQKLDPQKTVFVGALHGMLTAGGLAKIMDDLFEEVIYAGIDTDKYKYPIGSARVTFSSTRSYFKAITAAFIEIKTAKFTKKVQVDPYLEDSLCSVCSVQQGPYFCRELVCFRYFCRSCWQWQHSMDSIKHHKPRMRSSKTNQVVGLSPRVGMNNTGSRTPSNPAI